MTGILHLSWLPEPRHWPGIAAKLRQMATTARTAGLPLTVGACTDGEEIGGGVVCIPVAAGRMARLRRGAGLRQAIATLQPSATVLRWPGALDPSLPGLIRRHGGRMISEHHADEAAELRLLGGMWLRLRAAAEARLANRMIGRLAGAIGVTEEIRAGVARRSGLLRSLVIANGISVDSVAATGFRRFDGTCLELVWSCGRFWPWQGLDRLVEGLARSDTRLPVTVHLLGDLPTPPANHDRVTYVAHGLVTGPAADAVFARAHLALGTLALRRKGLSEACPLKIREYLARGLPFVTAHDDPDVPSAAPWCCRLPDDEAPIAIAEIIAFAERCRMLDPAELRAEADRRMGWRGKLEQLCAFAAEAVGA
jgi:glycosyltransferase involved in cell wall biosynthesis